jgi:hypothetical protein
MNDKEIIKKVITENIDLETLAGTSRIRKALMEAISLKLFEIKKEIKDKIEDIVYNTEEGGYGSDVVSYDKLLEIIDKIGKEIIMGKFNRPQYCIICGIFIGHYKIPATRCKKCRRIR